MIPTKKVNIISYTFMAYGLFTCLLAMGQFTLQGVVYDKLTGKQLPYASIIVTGRSAIGTVADSAGNFRIFMLNTFKNGEVNLSISRIGYRDTSFLVKVSSQGSLHIGLLPLLSELPAVNISGVAFRSKYTVGVAPSDRRFKNIMEGRGFGSVADSDVGLYFGHHDKGPIIIDSIQFHVPDWFKLNKGILIQCRESIAEPMNNIAILEYPLGRELMSKPYVFFPLQAGWQTIRFTQEKLVSHGRGVFVIFNVAEQGNLTNSGSFNGFSWFKGKGDYPFSAFWFDHEDKKLMLIHKKMNLGPGFNNIYPGVLVHYRAAK